MLTEILQGSGHHVCATASTEAEAVAAAARLAPDLLIVDLQLAEGSGVAAIAAILGKRFVPHVFMSGASPLQDSRSAPVLLKPFRESDLVRSIEAALIQFPNQPPIGGTPDVIFNPVASAYEPFDRT